MVASYNKIGCKEQQGSAATTKSLQQASVNRGLNLTATNAESNDLCK